MHGSVSKGNRTNPSQGEHATLTGALISSFCAILSSKAATGTPTPFANTDADCTHLRVRLGALAVHQLGLCLTLHGLIDDVYYWVGPAAV
jgi:hypothetical protein